MSANESATPGEGQFDNTFLRNSAIAGAIVTPILMLMPPRKFDFRFTILSGTFCLSTSYLVGHYTGESIYQRWERRFRGLDQSWGALPAEAEQTRQILLKHKIETAKRHQEQQAGATAAAAAATDTATAADSGLAKKVEDVWMGGEDENWQKKRAIEHQKQFDEGKGMGSIIIEQISDVWSGNWRPSSKNDDKTTTTPEKKA
jgi:hypothetical protein